MLFRSWTFTVITREAFAPLFAGHPAVKQVIALRDEDLPLGKLVPLFRKLAASAGTAGLVDLHGTPRSRLLSLFWKGPVRRFDKLTLERRAFLASGGALFRQRLNTCNIPQRYAGQLFRVEGKAAVAGRHRGGELQRSRTMGAAAMGEIGRAHV